MSVSRADGNELEPPPAYYPTTPFEPVEPAPPPPSGVPANWYPDPYSPGVMRYWDGIHWTEHRRAAAPTATATVYNNVKMSGDGSWTALHLILTILTCGLWLPIWLIIELIKAIAR